MNLTAINKLAAQVESDYRAVNHDDSRFAEIAQRHLSALEPDIALDGATLARFLSTTSVEQQPGNGFSNLPITLFRNRHFYIEVLVWSSSTTAIHEHGFTGAFRVLRGSSLHASYRFDERRGISELLRIGDIECQSIEYLQVGDTRSIVAGTGGTTHSLYHLDHPSATLVVRSYGLHKAQPQYLLVKPCFAVASSQLEKDERFVMLSRLAAFVGGTEPEALPCVWSELVAQLDFPSLLQLVLRNGARLGLDKHLDEFVELVREVHGSLADDLAEMVRIDAVEKQMFDARRASQDPEVRFLLALLLNAPDRRSMLDLIQTRFPDADPVQLCAEWLARLCQQKAATIRSFEALVAKADLNSSRIGSQLATRLPEGLATEQLPGFFAGLLAGAPVDGMDAAPRPPEAFQRVFELPGFEVLAGDG